MKSSFGRVFYAAALILLLALTMLGVSFQQLVKNYLTESTFSRLDQDAEVLSHLASSYAAGEDTSSQDFLLSLDVASRLTDTDIIICNAEGKVVLCSDSPFVCKHLKLQINSDYLEKVSSAGVDRTTGVIRGLYDDSRFLTAMPIQDETDGSLLGLVMVSVPTADTNAVLKKLANLYLRGGAPVRSGGAGLCGPVQPSPAGDGQGCQRLRPRQSGSPGPGGGLLQ